MSMMSRILHFQNLLKNCTVNIIFKYCKRKLIFCYMQESKIYRWESRKRDLITRVSCLIHDTGEMI